MNPCLSCGDKGDPRIVATYKGQCGECGREGPAGASFHEAWVAWNRENPSSEPVSLGYDSTSRALQAARAAKEKRRAFSVTRRTPIEDYYPGREL